MKNRETKYSPAVSVELKADTEKRIVEGYASVFGNVDAHDDVVVKGAFAKTISERKSRIKVLYQHDVYEPIGVPIEMKEDDTGLYTVSKLSTSEVGEKSLQLVKDGVLTEMSIGYDLIQGDFDADKHVNFLKEIKLWEYSLVTFGANDQALITGVKTISDIKHLQKEYNISDELIVKMFRQTLESIANEPLKDTHDEFEPLAKGIGDIIKLIKE